METDEIVATVNAFAERKMLNPNYPFDKKRIGRGVSLSLARVSGEPGGLQARLRVYSKDLSRDSVLELIVDNGEISGLLKYNPVEACHMVTAPLKSGPHTWRVEVCQENKEPSPSMDFQPVTTHQTA